jgi:hypothetical protein
MMRKAGHRTRKGKMRKAYKVFVGKPAVMRHYEDLDADGKRHIYIYNLF